MNTFCNAILVKLGLSDIMTWNIYLVEDEFQELRQHGYSTFRGCYRTFLEEVLHSIKYN